MADDIVITRDYTDSFSMKDFAFSTLAPKYFPDAQLSDLNIGLLGLTMEQISNFTEDAFRTSSILINEAYPNRSQIPENIYSHAAIFQLDSHFASCAQCSFILAVREEDVLKYSENMGEYKRFMIDADTTVSVNGIMFTLDYDICIKVQKNLGKYIYSAQYDLSFVNCTSNIANRYIRIRKTPNGYLNMSVIMHQTVREYATENIVNNSKINYPVLSESFSDQLAGFDVFYKPPGATTETQLVKRLLYTSPLKVPFCYYAFKDASMATSRPSEFSISFSSKDSYFQPEFNSDVRIVMYTTTGAEGNFDVYTGDDVTVITTGEKYEYNSHCIMAAVPVGSSTGGTNSITLEELRDRVIESYSTATVLSTENDLRFYFNNFAKKYGNEMMFIKKRDDIVERLFSSFMVMKRDDYIYPTNTLKIKVKSDQADYSDSSNIEMMIKPGHLFTYCEGSSDTVEIIPDIMVYDYDNNADLTSAIMKKLGVESLENTFVYSNPFLIKISRIPNSVGFYMNIVNNEYALDYGEVSTLSFIQFITSKLSITRGLSKESEFKINLTIAPTVSKDASELVSEFGKTGNNVRIIAAVIDDGLITGYIEMIPERNEGELIIFSAPIETDDYVTSTGKFRCTNAVNMVHGRDAVYIPTSNAVLRFYILHKNEDLYDGTPLFNNPDYSGFITTNIYSTSTSPISFIKPMSMLRSTVGFERASAEDPYTMMLSSIPFIKYDIINDSDKFPFFIASLTAQYNVMEESLELLQNTTHIDVKFYNTYGKSKNFYIGDDEEVIDKVNLTIKFKIQTMGTADTSDVIRDLKILIKEYIETLNNGVNELYISNLIRKIETDMPEIHHCRFLGINGYSCSYQTITNKTKTLDELPKHERRQYVPEMLVVNLDDIIISSYD